VNEHLEYAIAASVIGACLALVVFLFSGCTDPVTSPSAPQHPIPDTHPWGWRVPAPVDVPQDFP